MVQKHNSQVTPVIKKYPWLLSPTEGSPSVIWSLSTSSPPHISLAPFKQNCSLCMFTLPSSCSYSWYGKGLFSHSVHTDLFKSSLTVSFHFKDCIIQEARDNFSPLFRYLSCGILHYVQTLSTCTLPVVSWSLYQGKDQLWHLSDEFLTCSKFLMCNDSVELSWMWLSEMCQNNF